MPRAGRGATQFRLGLLDRRCPEFATNLVADIPIWQELGCRIAVTAEAVTLYPQSRYGGEFSVPLDPATPLGQPGAPLPLQLIVANGWGEILLDGHRILLAPMDGNYRHLVAVLKTDAPYAVLSDAAYTTLTPP